MYSPETITKLKPDRKGKVSTLKVTLTLESLDQRIKKIEELFDMRIKKIEAVLFRD